jgi:hypothetical protein
MSFKTQSIYTGTFTNTRFEIVEAMGLKIVSVNLISGVATILGTSNIPGLAIDRAPLTIGQPVVIPADPGYTLDGITIDSTSGGIFEVIAK